MSTGRPPAPEVASIATSAPSSAPSTRLTGAITPVEVSLCGQAYRSTPASATATGSRAGVGLHDGRVGQVRRELRGLGELRGELTEAQVLALLPDQPERRDVPERGRAAVAEHDLVAVGQLEQVGHTLLDPGHQVLHRRLPVRGAEQLGALGRQRGDGFRANLRRTGAEAAVRGLELCRNLNVAGHQRVPFVVCVQKADDAVSAPHPPTPRPPPVPTSRPGLTVRRLRCTELLVLAGELCGCRSGAATGPSGVSVHSPHAPPPSATSSSSSVPSIRSAGW